jgi:hypothetical protein
LAHLLRVDHAVALEISGLIAAPGDRFLAGDHVDHEPWGRGVFANETTGAVGTGAIAREGAALAEGEQCIGPTLVDRARITGANCGGQL